MGRGGRVVVEKPNLNPNATSPSSTSLPFAMLPSHGAAGAGRVPDSDHVPRK